MRQSEKQVNSLLMTRVNFSGCTLFRKKNVFLRFCQNRQLFPFFPVKKAVNMFYSVRASSYDSMDS